MDGLPALLLPDMAKLLQRPEMSNYRGVAIGMDMREADFPHSFNSALLALSTHGISVNLIFLEASESGIFNRYAATRRPHPLERTGIGLAGAIRKEKEELAAVREMADLVLDTTNFNIYDLRRAIRENFDSQKPLAEKLKINIISFGFKYGIPKDANYVFDLRFINNPYFVESLRDFNGKDAAVAEYVFSFPEPREFVAKILELFNYIFPLLIAEGRNRVTIAFGCTGGRHRSVAIAEKTAHELEKNGYAVILEHRNLDADLAQAACVNQSINAENSDKATKHEFH